MEETLRQHLSVCVAQFEAATGISPATVGKRALNDNTFFARIFAGQGFTVRTFDRVIEWLSENWPEGTPWPTDIPRPPVLPPPPRPASLGSAVNEVA